MDLKLKLLRLVREKATEFEVRPPRGTLLKQDVDTGERGGMSVFNLLFFHPEKDCCSSGGTYEMQDIGKFFRSSLGYRHTEI